MQSVKDETILQLVDSFKLSTETEKEPTFLQLIFWVDNIKYRYGFELDNKQIYAEWLYAKPGERELPYFIRENQKIIEIDKTNFSEGNKLVDLFGDDNSENNIFRTNSLFLSTISSLGFGKLSKQITNNIGSISVVNGLGYNGLFSYAKDLLNDEKRKKYITDFLKYGDTCIENIDVFDVLNEPAPEDYKKENINHSGKDKTRKVIISARKKYNENLELQDNGLFSFENMESEGTLKLFELSPFIFEALEENRPLIIDEFDARFHPLLTKKNNQFI